LARFFNRRKSLGLNDHTDEAVDTSGEALSGDARNRHQIGVASAVALKLATVEHTCAGNKLESIR